MGPRESDVIGLAHYKTFPVGFKVPALQTVLVNAMEAEANGAGEVSITVTAAAIGNAVFDATGVRLRQVPFYARAREDRIESRLIHPVGSLGDFRRFPLIRGVAPTG